MSLFELAWVFLKIGTLAVGDTGPVLAMIERELIDTRRVLTRDEVTEALTYTKLLPGSTVVQIVAYLAYRLGGWSASALATGAYLLPAALLMLLLATGYVAAAVLPALRPAVHGLTAAVVGILLATTYRLGRRNVSRGEPLTVLIAVVALGAGAFLEINAALVVVAGGLLGLLVLREPAPADTKTRGGAG
jgi:chromate transporter